MRVALAPAQVPSPALRLGVGVGEQRDGLGSHVAVTTGLGERVGLGTTLAERALQLGVEGDGALDHRERHRDLVVHLRPRLLIEDREGQQIGRGVGVAETAADRGHAGSRDQTELREQLGRRQHALAQRTGLGQQHRERRALARVRRGLLVCEEQGHRVGGQLPDRAHVEPRQRREARQQRLQPLARHQPAASRVLDIEVERDQPLRGDGEDLVAHRLERGGRGRQCGLRRQRRGGRDGGPATGGGSGGLGLGATHDLLIDHSRGALRGIRRKVSDGGESRLQGHVGAKGAKRGSGEDGSVGTGGPAWAAGGRR